MANKIVKNRLKSIPEKDKEEAQKKLDALFAKYDIPRWNIDAGSADWRELCFREILGFPAPIKKEPQKRGRKKLHSEKKEQKVADRMFAHKWFSKFDNNGKEIEPPLKGKKLLEKVAKEVGIKPRHKNHHDSTTPSETVRGINNRMLKKEKERLKKDHEDWNE